MLQLVVSLTLLLAVQFSGGYSKPRNAFESTYGCLQFDSDNGYFRDHPFFETSKFKNIARSSGGVTRMRMGVLGEKNAAIRFTTVSTNSVTSMIEIALAHYHNTQTDIRKYPRTIPRDPGLMDKLKSYPMRNLMSIYRPVMLTIAIQPGGNVTVTKDGDSEPFMEFEDASFSHKYVGFCDWDSPVIFFYDCPLLQGK